MATLSVGTYYMMKALLFGWGICLHLTLCAQTGLFRFREEMASARSLVKEKKYGEAISMLERLAAESGDSPEWTVHEKSQLYSTLGDCSYQTRNYGKSLEHYTKSLSFSTDNDTLGSDLYYSLSLAYYRMNKYDSAGICATKASELYLKLFGRENKNYTKCLNTLGVIFKEQARFKEAEKVLQEARQFNFKLTKGEDIQYARIVNNLADVYCALTRFEKAEMFYHVSLRIKEKLSGKISRDYANTLYNLADFHAHLGQYSRAQKCLQEGVDIFNTLGDTLHPDYLKFFDYLAILYDKSNQPEKAQGLLKMILYKREALQMTEQADYSINLINLGGVEVKLKNYEKALFYTKKALPLAKAIYGIKHPSYAGVLTNLANIYIKMGQYQQARTALEEASQIILQVLGNDHIEYFNVQFEYAKLLRKTGMRKEAIQIYRKIERIPKAYLKRASHYLSEQELNEKIQTYRAFCDEIFSFTRHEEDNAELTAIAYNNLLYYRGHILGTLQQMRIDIRTAKEITDLSDELVSLHRQLENEMNLPLNARKNVSWLEEQIQSLESQIAQRISSFSPDGRHPDWQEVQQALRTDETALEFVDFTDSSAGDTTFFGVLVLAPEMEHPRFLTLCTQSLLTTLVPLNAQRRSEYVSNIYAAFPRGAIPVSGKSASLSALLWQPLENLLGNTRRVFYVPSGILHRLSFAAIPISLEQTIADKVDLVLMGSTRELIPKDETIYIYDQNSAFIAGGIVYASHSGDITAVNTVFGNRTGVEFPFLPWTEKESREIKYLLETNKYDIAFLSGSDASEERITDTLSRGAGWRIIHIATHGFFQDNTEINSDTLETPSYNLGLFKSGLVLAGSDESSKIPADRQTADGILTAHEIIRLDLSKTELVVLSACETGLGDISSNEGVYGLQRAFKLAGAKNVVMSLWQVPDRETKDFMVSFYQNLLTHQTSIHEAFYKTQREMRDRFVDPYQWAGFILLE